jgi:DNA repair protein RadD
LKLEPRYYQQEAVDSIFDYYQSEDAGHSLVCLPTATGKSLVQSMIAEKILKEFPDCRILFVTHQPTLLEQNYNELIDNLGLIDAGIYSAKFKSRDEHNRIIFATIQSIHKKALNLGCFNLVIVDESHLVSPEQETMYRNYFKALFEIAPYCKIIGLTATPYRMKQGLLTEGEKALFDEIIYDYPLATAIKEGYVCKPVGKSSIHKPDTSGLHKRAGEYIDSEMEKIFDNQEIITAACEEMIGLTSERKHILIFCVSILHAEHVAKELTSLGLSCEAMHSKLPDSERDRITNEFKSGAIRAVTNVDCWTTGFNYKEIDCIVLMRLTASVGLLYQMCGRGFRIFPGKEDFLILDYAGNFLLHGPLDKIEVKTRGTAKDRGVHTAPMKECPQCKQPVFLSAMTCEHCGYKWPVTVNHGDMAGDAEPISKYQPPVEYNLEPYDTHYYVHEKNGQLSMRVTYTVTALNSVSEWVCIEHGGFAEKHARKWLKEALPSGYPIPDTVEDCMEMVDVFKKPCTIFVDYNQRFPRIISRIYPETEEPEETETPIINKSFVR